MSDPVATKLSLSKPLVEDVIGFSLPSCMKKVVFLANPAARRYFSSESIENGSYGKFKLAVDDQGQVWGIKELRHQEKTFRKYTSDGREIIRTHVTERHEALNEIDAIGRFSKRLKVEDEFEVDGKRYIVMTAMAGALDTVTTLVDEPAKRRAVARSTLKQMAEQLLDMQSQFYIHGDVKAANALVDEEGNISLSDFGKVTKIAPEKPDAPLPYHHTQTYQAPEKNWNRSAEVWALGVTIVQLLSRDSAHPYAFQNFVGDAKKGFLNWRRDLVATQECLDFYHLPKHVSWSAHAMGLATSDQDLFDFVIRRMLHPTPADGRSESDLTKRATMKEVCEKLQSLCTDSDTELARTAFREATAKLPKRQEIVEALKKVATNPPELSETASEYEDASDYETMTVYFDN